MVRGRYYPASPIVMRNIRYVISALVAVGFGLFLGEHRNYQELLGRSKPLQYVDPARVAHRDQPQASTADCGAQGKALYPGDIALLGALGHSSPSAQLIAIDSRRRQPVGIELADAQKGGQPSRLRLLGRVTPDPTHVYQVNIAADGFVKEISDEGVGSYVKKDQRLAVIYSQEFLSIAGGFLSAYERTQNKEDSTATQGVASPQTWADRLRNLGMSDSQIKELVVTRKVPEVVYINSPVDGFILARNISPGQKFDRYTEFYRIADLTRVWIVADLFPNEVQYFEPGTTARITLPDHEHSLLAKVANVLPEVNPSTRTLQVRLEADNRGSVLRPGVFVDIELSGPVSKALTIPVDAVLHSYTRDYIFVDHDGGCFERREVETGRYSGDRVEILKGLHDGEQVVASGGFLVNAEEHLHTVSHEMTPSEKTHSVGDFQDAKCILPADSLATLPSGPGATSDGTTSYPCSHIGSGKSEQEHTRYLPPKPRGDND